MKDWSFHGTGNQRLATFFLKLLLGHQDRPKPEAVVYLVIIHHKEDNDDGLWKNEKTEVHN